MNKNLNDLAAFVAVAETRSFTKAAAQQGVSPSALSHTIRGLEERLGVTLLTRTTRSVSTTEAGARLLETIRPRFEEIEEALKGIVDSANQPAGLIRITVAEHAADTVLWQRISPFLATYPDIKIEINVNYGMTDIVREGFHAGVRLGDQVAKDMVAVRIGADFKMVVVGSPAYFADHPIPKTPHDLSAHRCINLRLPTHDNFMLWEFEQVGRPFKVRVDGPLAFNMGSHILRAALAGHGLAYLPEDAVSSPIASGQLLSVLTPWCPSFPGYHLYFPFRHPKSSAFALLVDTLRFSTRAAQE